jgi:hypothetical protein
MAFGAPFRALPRAAVEAASTPGAGAGQEAIWHQLFDTQTFTSAATVSLTFFQTANADKTLSNIDQGGTLPRFSSLQIHDVTADYLALAPVSTLAGATTVGVLNDLALLVLGSAQRPTWTLTISQKAYGPYSLTVLHGTGGPAGFGWGGNGANFQQYARNEPSSGWNYFGRVIIPEQVSFSLTILWAATATLTGDTRIRASLFGVFNRRVL